MKIKNHKLFLIRKWVVWGCSLILMFWGIYSLFPFFISTTTALTTLSIEIKNNGASPELRYMVIISSLYIFCVVVSLIINLFDKLSTALINNIKDEYDKVK